MMPSLITAVIFKNKKYSYQCFHQQASYIFSKNSEDEWYNLGHRTFECTKNTMINKLYVTLKLYGEELFSKYLDRAYGLAKYFAELVNKSEDFELAIEPQSNVVCFRYLGKGDLDQLQAKIREELVKSMIFILCKPNLTEGFIFELLL